jgi:hypothetical protein
LDRHPCRCKLGGNVFRSSSHDCRVEQFVRSWPAS